MSPGAIHPRDGEAFNLFRSPRKYLREKGLVDNSRRGDDPGEHPPVAVIRAMADAGSSPDYKHIGTARRGLQALCNHLEGLRS
jgi:hypothetical protein